MNSLTRLRVLLGVACISLLWVLMSLAEHMWSPSFGRADIFLVTLSGALLTVFWGAPMRYTWRVQMLIGGALFLSIAILLWSSTGRYVVALLTMQAIALFIAMWRSKTVPVRLSSMFQSICVPLLGVVVPLAYVHSAVRLAEGEARDALQSQRYVLAQQDLKLVALLAPNADIMGSPVADLLNLLEEEIDRLRSMLEMPFAVERGTSDVARRAIANMQLSQERRALELLVPLTRKEPVAFDYCGLCCQRLGDWQASLHWYRQSLEYWQSRPEDGQQRGAMVSAWKGIAFAARKLDDPRTATDAYQQALAWEPSAELHFLLAQHYEEQQQTQMAHQHVQRAMALDPGNYADSGKMLLQRMALSHFQCHLVK